MGDETTCIILSFGWVPFTAIALTILILFYTRFRLETDIIKKDKIQRLIKYPVIFLILTLLSIPLWNILSYQLLGEECGLISKPKPIPNKIIKTFSDNTTKKDLTLSKDGGVDSEIKIILPRNAKIISSEITIEHPFQNKWRDDFRNTSLLEKNDAIQVSRGNAKIKSTTLEITQKITLYGTQLFDDVHIYSGGEISVPKGTKLDMLVKGELRIDEGGGINADGNIKENLDVRDTYESGEAGSGGGGGGYGGEGGKGGDDPPMIGGRGDEENGKADDPKGIGLSGGRGGGTRNEPGTGLVSSGGLGGGEIRIEAKKIILDGYINADGGKGMPSSYTDGTGGGGGGSGGTIVITVDDLTFTGKISADGGRGGDDRQPIGEKAGSDGGGGGGGGGRILITYDKKADFGTVSAKGGDGGKSGDPSKNGQRGKEGSILWKQTDIAGMSMVRINATSLIILPDNLDKWTYFHANASTESGTEIKYYILDASNDETICRFDEKETANKTSIENCSKYAYSLKLVAELSTISFLRTPELDYWEIGYESAVRGFELDIGLDQSPEYEDKRLSGKHIISDNNTSPRLSENLEALAKECSCRGCMPMASGECIIPIRVLSKSSGRIILRDFKIEYKNQA